MTPSPQRAGRALDIAAEHLQQNPHEAVSGRQLSNVINTAFARTPATSGWTVGRAELEAWLAGDGRFVSSDEQWILTSGAIDAPIQMQPILVAALRPGIDLPLHLWQREAVEAWNAAGRRGIIEAVTASGKTRVAETVLATYLGVDNARAAVIVPTIDLANQWLRRLYAILSLPVALVGDLESSDFSASSVLVCIARTAADVLPSLVQRTNHRTSVLLIADECHRYGSEIYRRALEAPYAATLGLSATPERANDDGMQRFVVPRLGPIVFSYDHDRGLAENVISEFRTCFVGVDFHPIEQSEYKRLSSALDRAHRALEGEFPFLAEATPFIAAVRSLAQRDEEGLAANYLRIAAERRRLVTAAQVRHDVVSWLAEHGALANQRTLIFHESIADCEHIASELLTHGIRAAAHHSQLDRETRRTRLAAFANGDLNAVVAPRTLDEGIDVPDASLAIIVAGTRVRRQTVQRIGRVLRRAEGKAIARVVIIYVRGAADDPRGRNAPEAAKELLRRPGTLDLSWPLEAEDVLRFIDAPRACSRDSL